MIIDKEDKFRFMTSGERPLMFYKFNQTMFCPFQNKIPIQNKLSGQIQLEAIPCNECCPHFSVINTLADPKTDEILFYDVKLTCATPIEIRLKVDDKPNTISSSNIHLTSN